MATAHGLLHERTPRKAGTANHKKLHPAPHRHDPGPRMQGLHLPLAWLGFPKITQPPGVSIEGESPPAGPLAWQVRALCGWREAGAVSEHDELHRPPIR